MLHLKLIISLSFSFLLFIDCFISAKMRTLSFILSRKGRFSALERAFSGTLKGVVPKKFSGGQPPNPKFLFASLACPPHILAAGAAPDCHITQASPKFPPAFMHGYKLDISSFFTQLGLSISSNLTWKLHVHSIAKHASQKLGFLSRARGYFSPPQLLTIYKSQIRYSLEYYSHVWVGAPTSSLYLLDRVLSKDRFPLKRMHRFGRGRRRFMHA